MLMLRFVTSVFSESRGDTMPINMPDNPYSSPTSQDPGVSDKSSGTALRTFVKYAGAYLCGICCCVVLTPVELELAGLPLWPFYPIFAVVGFALFYLYLKGAYLPFGGSGVVFWVLYSVGFIPVPCELIAFLSRNSLIRTGRPFWIGFPVGFVGTMGVYYTAAASI